jgi:hypothetical protein
MSDLVCLFQVISSAVGAGAVEVLFSTPAAKDKADLIYELSSRVQLVFIVEILREA